MEIFYSHLEIVYKLRAAKIYVLFKKSCFRRYRRKQEDSVYSLLTLVMDKMRNLHILYTEKSLTLCKYYSLIAKMSLHCQHSFGHKY